MYGEQASLRMHLDLNLKYNVDHIVVENLFPSAQLAINLKKGTLYGLKIPRTERTGIQMMQNKAKNC